MEESQVKTNATGAWLGYAGHAALVVAVGVWLLPKDAHKGTEFVLVPEQRPKKPNCNGLEISVANQTRCFIPGGGNAEWFKDCDVCPEMVLVPSGTFLMGSPVGEEGRESNEGHQHQRTVQRPFAVGRFEVTFPEWYACVAEGGCKHIPGDEGWGTARRPVINVSWHDAKEYTHWLSRRTGKRYRLLSEAEWEYAARAGTTTRYAFGDFITKGLAQHSEGRPEFETLKRSGSITHPVESGELLKRNDWRNSDRTAVVGAFPANKFGIYDMHGNASEWCEDGWHSTYHLDAPIDGSAWDGGDLSRRIVRGGSWYSPPSSLRSAKRGAYSPDIRDNVTGFRVARTI